MDNFPQLLDNLLTVQIKTLHRMLLTVRDGCVDSIEAKTKVHSPDRRSIMACFLITGQAPDLYRLEIKDSTGYNFSASLNRSELSSAIDACAKF